MNIIAINTVKKPPGVTAVADASNERGQASGCQQFPLNSGYEKTIADFLLVDSRPLRRAERFPGR